MVARAIFDFATRAPAPTLRFVIKIAFSSPTFYGRMLAISCLFTFSSGFLRAESTSELKDQLRVALRAEIQTALQDKTLAGWARCRGLQSTFVEFAQAEMNAPSANRFLPTVERIEAASSSKEVTELCQRLKKQLRAEEKQKETALIEEVQQGLATTLREALAARTLAKLDASGQAATRLAETANATYAGNQQLLQLAQEGHQLADYIRRYQDFSMGMETGGSLHPLWCKLVDSPDGFAALIPRSEVLAESQGKQSPTLTVPEQNERVREILSRVHSLEDIDAALAAFEKLNKTRYHGEFSTYRQQASASLRSYQIILHDLDAGIATSKHLRETIASGAAASDETLSELRTQLLLRALPRLLEIQQTLPPEPNDNAATYLHRVVVTARDKADWSLFARALALASELTIDPEFASRESAAAQLLLGAFNQERAGGYAGAVRSYELVLKTGALLIPAEFIGEQLEHLRKTQPEEFKKGVDLASIASPPKPAVWQDRGNTLYDGGASIIDLGPPQGDITVPAAPSRPPKSIAAPTVN